MIIIEKGNGFYSIKTHLKEYELSTEPDNLNKQSDFDNTDVLLNFIDDIRPAEFEKVEVNKLELLEEVFEIYLHKGFKSFKNWFKEECKIYSKEQIEIFKNGILF